MNGKFLPYLELHFAVMLFGLTAILGDLISVSALSLVWWRVLITSLSLLFFISFGRHLHRLGRKQIMIYIGIGFIVGLHWLSFYGAIKFSNASIVLAAMATASLFTSLVEPLFLKKKVRMLEVFIGLLVVPPMLMIAQNIDLSMQRGLWIGLLSALLAAVFSSLNKKYIDKASPLEISFLEISGTLILVTILLPFFKDNYLFLPTGIDWVYLLILALACTTLAYVLGIRALKHLSAFDSNLVVNMEPVYGILLAIVILQEHHEMSPQFYWGVGIIMLIVFSHPFIKKKFYGRR